MMNIENMRFDDDDDGYDDSLFNKKHKWLYGTIDRFFHPVHREILM